MSHENYFFWQKNKKKQKIFVVFLKYLYNIPIDLMLKVINKINSRTTFCKQFVNEKYIRYLKQINHNVYKVSE